MLSNTLKNYLPYYTRYDIRNLFLKNKTDSVLEKALYLGHLCTFGEVDKIKLFFRLFWV